MDKKSVIIGALASALLFVTLGASNPNTYQSTVPESHVWEMQNAGLQLWTLNKETGEVRQYSSAQAGRSVATYKVCTPE